MQIKNVRFIIAAITTLSAYAVYVSRVNLSIAIIAMVEDDHLQHSSGALSNQPSADAGERVADRTEPLNGSNWTTSVQSADSRTQQQNYHSLNGLQQQQHQTGRHWMLSSTNNSNLARSNSALLEEKPHRDPFAINFPASKGSLNNGPLISQTKFHWDQTEQGHILGAFFYGYILFQVPGARMAELVGARWILICATAGSALISLIFPLSTQLNSIHLLMVLRFVMGLCQSAFFPAAYVFFCRWLPEHERSVLLPIMFIGSNMGSISTYIMSSYLISSSYGWPSVFYVSGLICLLVTLFWLLFGSNGPHDNRFITNEERDYILTSINNQNHCEEADRLADAKRGSFVIGNKEQAMVLAKLSTGGAPPNQRNSELLLGRAQIKSNQLAGGVGGKLLNKSKSANDLVPDALRSSFNQNNIGQLSPIVDLNQAKNSTQETDKELCWSKLLRSVPIWTLILSMYGNEWSQVVLTYELPTYLNTALNFPIEQNGVINSFFQLSYTLASPIMSSLGAYLLDRHLLKMQKIHVRKLFQSLATFGQMACFLSVPICGANRGLIIMFMFSAIVFKACANAGDIMVPGDLSPEYAGTIFAFANSIGNTAGFFVPLLAGVIVSNAYEREQWTPFWLTSASIMGCSGLIFLILGQTKRQNFSIEPSPEITPKELERRPERSSGQVY